MRQNSDGWYSIVRYVSFALASIVLAACGGGGGGGSGISSGTGTGSGGGGSGISSGTGTGGGGGGSNGNAGGGVATPVPTVYVAEFSAFKINTLTINESTGALSIAPGSPTAATLGGTYYIAIDPKLPTAYVIGYGSITPYTINDSTGALTEVTSESYYDNGNPTAAAIDASGEYLFAADGSGTLTVLQIKTDGSLTPVSGSPFPAGSQPKALIVDPAAPFVYIANAGDATITGYSFNLTTGAVAAIPGGPWAVGGSDPQSLAIDPSGTFLFVVNLQTRNISAFTINSATGTLSPVSGSPFPSPSFTAVQSAVVDLSGHYLYVADGNDILSFAISSNTGALTALAANPHLASGRPGPLALDSSGKFLYALDTTLNVVDAYSINSSNGIVSPISGDPFSTEADGKNGGATMLAISN